MDVLFLQDGRGDTRNAEMIDGFFSSLLSKESEQWFLEQPRRTERTEQNISVSWGFSSQPDLAETN